MNQSLLFDALLLLNIVVWASVAGFKFAIWQVRRDARR